MINSNIEALNLILPDFGPYFEHQFRDQSDIGVGRGIKRFVNSLAPKKLFQAANQIDEWNRNHKNEIPIVTALREGIRVKISLMGIFILSKHPSLTKMNSYAVKEAILTKSSDKQIASQIKHNPEYLDKVGRVLLKLKREQPKKARDFCFSLTQELMSEKSLHDRCIKLIIQFNDNETTKRLHNYFASVSLITKEPHPFTARIEDAYADLFPKEEVKKEVKEDKKIPIILISTLILSIIGFAVSYILGALIALAGAAVVAINY